MGSVSEFEVDSQRRKLNRKQQRARGCYHFKRLVRLEKARLLMDRRFLLFYANSFPHFHDFLLDMVHH